MTAFGSDVGVQSEAAKENNETVGEGGCRCKRATTATIQHKTRWRWWGRDDIRLPMDNVIWWWQRLDRCNGIVYRWAKLKKLCSKFTEYYWISAHSMRYGYFLNIVHPLFLFCLLPTDYVLWNDSFIILLSFQVSGSLSPLRHMHPVALTHFHRVLLDFGSSYAIWLLLQYCTHPLERFAYQMPQLSGFR